MGEEQTPFIETALGGFGVYIGVKDGGWVGLQMETQFESHCQAHLVFICRKLLFPLKEKLINTWSFVFTT